MGDDKICQNMFVICNYLKIDPWLACWLCLVWQVNPVNI